MAVGSLEELFRNQKLLQYAVVNFMCVQRPFAKGFFDTANQSWLSSGFQALPCPSRETFLPVVVLVF